MISALCILGTYTASANDNNDAEWYKMKTTFFNADEGTSITLSCLDSGYVQIHSNGTTIMSFDPSQYSISDEYYEYNPLLVSNTVIRYYPESSEIIVISDGNENSYFCVDGLSDGRDQNEQQSLSEDDIEEMRKYSSYNWKYISDTIEGNVFRTHIKSYTHYVDDFGALVIAVQSRIENISGEEVYFWTENYYKLTNSGIIKTPTCDNWGDLLAPGAVLNVNLEFRYDISTGVDFTGMVLDVEGTEVHLKGRPQSAEEAIKFEGYYTDPNTRDIMIVEEREDYSYNLIHIVYLYYPSNKTYQLFSYLEYSNFAPDNNGYFTLDNTQYHWNKYEYTIQKAIDPPYILTKQN